MWCVIRGSRITRKTYASRDYSVVASSKIQTVCKLKHLLQLFSCKHSTPHQIKPIFPITLVHINTLRAYQHLTHMWIWQVLHIEMWTFVHWWIRFICVTLQTSIVCDNCILGSILTIILSDWLEPFNPSREDLDPTRKRQMLSNYRCVFTTHRKQTCKWLLYICTDNQSTADWLGVRGWAY